LFDGISSGQLALERAGIKVDKYYASEIDKYAIKVTQKNYPDTIQLGDATKWRDWNIDWNNIGLLLAGFPCQSWSKAGKETGDKDPRGSLMWIMLDILNYLRTFNPDILFLFENVNMKKEFQEYCSQAIGVEPILINSSLLSAQNRKRLYWTNIPGIKQPEDKHIYLKDILESEGIVGRMVGRRIKDGKRADYDFSIKPIQRFEPRIDGKSGTLTTVLKDNIVFNDNDYRNLTPIEYERLQILPENYTKAIANSQRYKVVANGWNVDTVAHIFSYIKLIK
jgi:site-specific DNA-cytosine methylase